MTVERFGQGVLSFARALAEVSGPITVTKTVAVHPRTEREKRDDVLDALAECRARAVALAREAAVAIERERGSVTSPQVLARLRERGHGPLLDSIDRRFMGVVFNRGWERVGWENAGSHARPVAVWRRSR